MESFKIMGPALPVFFGKKCQQNSHFSLDKYLWQNVGSFSPFQKGITLFLFKNEHKKIFALFFEKWDTFSFEIVATNCANKGEI